MSALPFDSEIHGTISIDHDGDVTVVRLLGEHDISTASDLRAELGAWIGPGGLVVSLAETEFFDSSVIHALFDADARLKQRDRRLVLHVGTPPIVERVLELCGLRRQVHCTESLEEATALAKLPVESAGWSTR